MLDFLVSSSWLIDSKANIQHIYACFGKQLMIPVACLVVWRVRNMNLGQHVFQRGFVPKGGALIVIRSNINDLEISNLICGRGIIVMI